MSSHSSFRTTRTLIAVLLIAVSFLTSCSSEDPVPRDARTVVALVTGTGNEPGATLGSPSLAPFAAAAESDTGRAYVLSAEGTAAPEQVDLTPARGEQVEYGKAREHKIQANLGRLQEVLRATRSQSGQVDLLAALDRARRLLPDGGTIVVVSSGLATHGALDLRQAGWVAPAEQVADDLQRRQALPDLTGVRVRFVGLGEVAGPQPPLTVPARHALEAYWTAVCVRAGARECTVDTAPRPVLPPQGVAVPVVPIPRIGSFVGPAGGCVSLYDSQLGFAGGSADLTAAGRSLLAGIASEFAGRRGTLEVTGYTADPADSTEEYRRALGDARARAVADALRPALPGMRIDTATGGAYPGRTAVVNGRFDERRARAMRLVVLRLRTELAGSEGCPRT